MHWLGRSLVISFSLWKSWVWKPTQDVLSTNSISQFTVNCSSVESTLSQIRITPGEACLGSTHQCVTLAANDTFWWWITSGITNRFPFDTLWAGMSDRMRALENSNVWKRCHGQIARSAESGTWWRLHREGTSYSTSSVAGKLSAFAAMNTVVMSCSLVSTTRALPGVHLTLTRELLFSSPIAIVRVKLTIPPTGISRWNIRVSLTRNILLNFPPSTVPGFTAGTSISNWMWETLRESMSLFPLDEWRRIVQTRPRVSGQGRSQVDILKCRKKHTFQIHSNLH